MRQGAASNLSRRQGLIVLGLAGLGANGSAWAASDADKPFADHRLVLQLSDREAARQALVLSVAYNMLEAYGVDRISIEIVAFGPGIELLRRDGPNRPLVDSLIAQGVVFNACMNTVATIERETGKPFLLNPKALQVTTGVAKILSLAETGYTLVRP